VLNNKEKSRIEQLLERVILYCLMNQTENDFAVSGACQTWMDSIERPGAQIEMQTFRLKIYNLAGRLSASAVKREFWQRLEAKLLLKTRQYFLIIQRHLIVLIRKQASRILLRVPIFFGCLYLSSASAKK